MELGSGYGVRNPNRIKQFNGGRFGLNSDTILVFKLPDSRALRVVSRSVFLAIVIVTLPAICSFLREPSSSYFYNRADSLNVELLDLLIHDLADEGLYKKGDKILVVAPGIAGLNDDSSFVKGNEIDLTTEFDMEHQSLITDETFDLVFTSGLVDTWFVDRVVKIGGVVALQLSNYPSNAFQEQSNYKIIYLRRFDSTIVALRKTGPVDESGNFSTRRRLCKLASEAKKAALKGLEDVLLEPPRRALAKSNKYLKKFKYLPDLLGISPEVYKRRVFITVGVTEENDSVVKWFHQNYPIGNQEFEVYNVEMLPEEGIDFSGWLAKNVKEEEYVVMKAEAEVVEDMIKRKTICLVDELFFECKNQWREGDKSKRAYWECIALYGRLRDEGVAVHQWWA